MKNLFEVFIASLLTYKKAFTIKTVFKKYIDLLGPVMDILPTCLKMVGARYPEEYSGHQITPMDRKSPTPIFNGKQRKEHDRLFFEHVGGKALLEDDWKIVSLGKNNDPWHLYNIAEDPTETRNLAEKYPGKVKRMGEAWKSWARDMGLKGNQLEL